MKSVLLICSILMASVVNANPILSAKSTYKGNVFLEPQRQCQMQVHSFWISSKDKKTITKIEATMETPIGQKKMILELFPDYPVGNAGVITFSTLPKKFFNWGQMRKQAYALAFDIIEIKLNEKQELVSYTFDASSVSGRKIKNINDYTFACVF